MQTMVEKVSNSQLWLTIEIVSGNITLIRKLAKNLVTFTFREGEKSYQ